MMIPPTEEGDFLKDKSAGLLLHVSSLPSRHGIGDIGGAVEHLLPFLIQTGQKKWQILPLHPVGYGNSPYQGLSVYAGNEWLISPDLLNQQFKIESTLMKHPPEFDKNLIDFHEVEKWKETLFQDAFNQFRREKPPTDFKWFVEQHHHWLADYCLFMVIKNKQRDRPWHLWPEKLRNRHQSALDEISKRYEEELSYRTFLQYVFYSQWQKMSRQFRKANIDIIGDLPIFVAHDSADVWSHQKLFQLDHKGEPTVIAGVPPDYFSATGQRWGNPHYHWKLMEENDFTWWKMRVEHLLNMVDTVRIDHFRGFEAYWEIPGNEKTAVKGRWVKAPGLKLFRSLENKLGKLPFIAEDLGVITPEVVALKKQFGLPGMKILQFSFSPKVIRRERPAHYEKNTYAYTGTHDNDTLKGWLTTDGFLDEGVRQVLSRYHQIKAINPLEDSCKQLIRLLMRTNAGCVIVPLQDYHFLDGKYRMNYPGTTGGTNWRFRSKAEHYSDETTNQWILNEIKSSGRS